MAGLFSLQFGQGFLRSIKPEPAVVRKPHARSMAAGNYQPPETIDLAHFLERYSRLPKHTLPVGIDEEGSPVLFDLKDARPGPLLVLGDKDEGRTGFLRLLTYGIDSGQGAAETRYMVASAQPELWKKWVSGLKNPDSCLGIFDYAGIEAGEWVIRLAERAEQRLNGKRRNNPIILMIDDIRLLTQADPDVRLNFEWLCNHGPQVQIWPVLALPTLQALKNGRWIRFFRTRVLGKMTSQTAARLGLYGGLESETLDPQRQFAIRTQDTWVKFWLPILDANHIHANEEVVL